MSRRSLDDSLIAVLMFAFGLLAVGSLLHDAWTDTGALAYTLQV